MGYIGALGVWGCFWDFVCGFEGLGFSWAFGVCRGFKGLGGGGFWVFVCGFEGLGLI